LSGCALSVAQAVSARGTTAPVRPFSAVAVGVTVGSAGIGLEVATPLGERFNLRGNASLFEYNGDFSSDGLNYDADIKVRSVSESLDWFPFGNGFRISPGLTIDNGNSFTATLAVPGGQSFDLGDTTYTSLLTDPIHGNATLKFGRHVAPSITTGWGNILPRNGRRFSVPFEVGFQYIGTPLLTLDLAGTGCSVDGCGSLQTDPDSVANIQQQQDKLNKDIHPLRFYPILSTGFAYRF
jgi:hypothetical protein